MVVISVYTYGVKIIKKFWWESSFLWGGSMEPPLCTNGSAGYLMQLSVNSVGSQCIALDTQIDCAHEMVDPPKQSDWLYFNIPI